jgi:hypothetical protein
MAVAKFSALIGAVLERSRYAITVPLGDPSAGAVQPSSTVRVP